MSSTELCDQDNVAQAQFAIMTAHGPLALCGHHYRDHAFMIGLLGYPVESLAAVTVPDHVIIYGTPDGPLVRLAPW